MNSLKLEALPKLHHTQPRVAESQVQRAVFKYLRLHRSVAWAHRMNTGAMSGEYRRKRDEQTRRRFIRFAFPGCSDILGQMKDGRFLAVECKAPDGELSERQAAFLRLVRDNGGVAGVARDLDSVATLLENAT